MVGDFVSRGKGSEHYSFEVNGQRTIVHSGPDGCVEEERGEHLPSELKQVPVGTDRTEGSLSRYTLSNG
jgi:hypothetical protein